MQTVQKGQQIICREAGDELITELKYLATLPDHWCHLRNWCLQ